MLKKFDVPCGVLNTDSCSAYAGVSFKNRSIFLVFRGSTGKIQILSQALESVFRLRKAFENGVRVNRYFFESFSKVWNAGMREHFMELRKAYPDYEVWVTGHSLGGAMASVAAGALVYVGHSELSLIQKP
ncbi:hypothetical protein L596_028190 [Steinernema carpocapsae]|uniref:Fungal lipase-type domain-containing protein n=1 Tax=Steinernema carpocapsae TaxID=34508 RepID=A0A4U5LXR5_STECR|nr:hypothetical protein L596_028190 [Steinernema carpocapsae]